MHLSRRSKIGSCSKGLFAKLQRNDAFRDGLNSGHLVTIVPCLRQMSANTLPAYAAEPSRTPIPTIKTMPSPADLFEQTPLEIVMRLSFVKNTDGAGSMSFAQVDGHQPTVRLIHEYINTHCRGRITTKLNDTVYSGIQQLQVDEIKNIPARTPFSPLSPFLIVAVVEKVMGFEPYVVPQGANGIWMWIWRRSSAFA